MLYGDQFYSLDQILDSLTGYGRIEVFQSYQIDKTADGSDFFNPIKNSQKNFLTILKEGHFHGALPEGYARVINFDHLVAVGFFRQGFAWGKHQYYRFGELYHEGLYNNYNPPMESMKGVPIQDMTIKSFETNIDPTTMLIIP